MSTPERGELRGADVKFQPRILGIIALSALALPLAACTGGENLPSVTVDTLEAPASMSPTEPVIDRLGDVLPATESLPLAFGGAVTEPGKASLPGVWLSDDGVTWKRTVVDSSLEGAFYGGLSGSSERAALGGSVLKDRAYSSVLWVSKDRADWKRIELPEAFHSAHRLLYLTVIGTRVFGIGQSTDGEVAGVAVAGDKASSMALPQPPKGQLLRPLAITGGEAGLLLLASPAPEGDRAPTVSYLSTDNGKTWGDAVELASETSAIDGVTWTGSAFVATGSSPRTDEAGASSRPTAWVSTDGTSWAAEAVPAPPGDDPFYLLDQADAWFGAPTASADGTVAVIASNANSAVSALYKRASSGAWAYSGFSGVNQASGETGVAVPLANGSTAALLGEGGWLRSGIFSDGGYAEGTVIAPRQFLDTPTDFYAGKSSVDVVLRKRTFTVDDNYGWRNSSTYSLAEFTGGKAVSAVPWDPEGVGALLGVTMASSEAGAKVITGSVFPEGQSVIVPQGFFRADDAAPWTPMTGFPTEGATEFYQLASTATGWVAVGVYRESSNAGTPSHAVAWQSADGVAWNRVAGDFGAGMLETSLSDVCVLPDGSPIGIGWTEVSTGSFRMAAWAPEGDAWAQQDLGEFGEREGYGSSCANDKDGVVVAATISGRDVILRTTTGHDWRRVFKAERGVDLRNPVAVPGGFAAAGSWANDTTAGPVVWLSRDGITWKPVAIPSRNNAATTFVAAAKKDLLVSMSAVSGGPMLAIRDIAKVIDQLVPAATK